MRTLSRLPVLLLLAAVLASAAVPFSREMTRGDTTIMLGVHTDLNALLGCTTCPPPGVQVMVKTADERAAGFVVAVTAWIDGALARRETTVARAPDGYTLSVLSFGRPLKPDDVVAVYVYKILPGETFTE